MNYNDPRIEKMKNMTLGEMFDSVFDSRKKEREEAIRRCAELEEENRRLRTVAEKAQKLISGCKPLDCKPIDGNKKCLYECRWFALKEALAVLENEEKPPQGGSGVPPKPPQKVIIVDEDDGYCD